MSWYWSGDSKAGDKDVWVEYDHATATKLERAFQRSAKKSKLDKERFIIHIFLAFCILISCRYIDMADRNKIMQRRYSDPEMARFVKREVHDGGPAPKKLKAALILMQ